MDQRYYIGNNAFEELDSVILEKEYKRIFIVHGKQSFILSGAQKYISEILERHSCETEEFVDYTENPKLEDVHKGLNRLKEFGKVDLIVGIGGGSSLDIAKLIRFFNSFTGNFRENLYKQVKSLIPLITIPTTAGSGSEATKFAVVYEKNIKFSVEHPDLLADYALICPWLTYSNGKYLTACTGFDALSQAIESFWNLNSTEESEEYAVKAINLIWDTLPSLIERPSNILRDKMAEGAYWAGRAINITKTTAPHAISYPFTTFYGYPHGHAVALFFPEIASCNLKSSLISKYKKDKLMTLLDIKDGEIERVLKEYIERLGLSIEQKKYDLDTILSHINLQRLKNNPYKFKEGDLENLIKKIKG